jgi:hypothetical protein
MDTYPFSSFNFFYRMGESYILERPFKRAVLDFWGTYMYVSEKKGGDIRHRVIVEMRISFSYN